MRATSRSRLRQFRHLLCFLLVAVSWVTASPSSGANDAVFQYSVETATKRGHAAAFLWIPPQATKIRGVLVAGMTSAEREIVRDAQVRAASTDEQLAIVFVQSGLGAVDVQRTLDDLAKVSGYHELAQAPLFFVGHSAGGPQALAAAVKFADRCFGLMQHRGGAPSWAPPLPPGIPALMMVGQFDEFGKALMRDERGRENWENGRDDLARFRATHPANLGSIVVEPGAGHFAWSDRNATYFSLFLRAAARARIPSTLPRGTKPVPCKPVDPATGWLSDLSLGSPAHPPAPYATYQGDKTRANWHLDRALAEAAVRYHQGLGKRDQFLRWTDRMTVEAGARFFLRQVVWNEDGASFDVHPVYAERYPTTQPDGQGPRWPLAGQPVGHGPQPIRVRAVGGPIVAVGDRRFELRFDALAPATESGRPTFLAYSEGDAQHRYTEQVGMVRKGTVSPRRDLLLEIARIPDLKRHGGGVRLPATSVDGSPVRHYVAFGPARIIDGKLTVADLPRRARLPLQVKVVSYQVRPGNTAETRDVVLAEQSVRIVAR